MAYTKTTWANGDVITAEKLNNIENGVESASSGGLLVTATGNSYSGYTVDTDVEEIVSSILAGMNVILKIPQSTNSTPKVYHLLAPLTYSITNGETVDETVKAVTFYTIAVASTGVAMTTIQISKTGNADQTVAFSMSVYPQA